MDAKKTKFLILFNLSEKFTEKELKESYRDLAHVWHPDKHNHNGRLRKKAEDQFKEINEGYAYLYQILKYGGSATSSYSKPDPEDFTSYKSASQDSASGANTAPKNKAGTEQKGKQVQKKSVDWFSMGLIVLIIGIFFVSVYLINNALDYPAGSSSNNSFYETKGVISEKLDEKNGFKQFQFRMSVSEAEKVQLPTKKNKYERNETTILFYENNETMNIGTYPIDNVRLTFFKDSLYRIDITFSSYQSAIYQTFVLAFGQPYNNSSWTSGDQPLKAKSWEGNVVLCTILAQKKSSEAFGWESIVIFDKEVYRQASEYKKNEPVRASKMIHNNGLGNVKLKIGFKEFIKLFDSTPHVVELEFEQKSVYVRGPGVFKIGYYPIDSVKGYFFKNKLYRFDVHFSENREELFKSFISRFPNSVEDNSWARGKQALIAMAFTEGDNVALIVGPKSKDIQWESLVFYSVEYTEEKNKFVREAPKRAAADI